MANDGSVIIGTELDESGLKAGLDDLNKSVNTWGAAVVGSKAFRAITEGLIKTAKAGIEYNAQMEDYQTNFTVLLGDEAKALEYVAQMRETAAKTPFGMEDLASANQTLLSFGLTAEETQVAVQQLGDISMGNAERFSSLSLAFAQVSSAGKLTGQDLLQMINAGFNPLNTIAEKTGTSVGDLKEVMSGGKGSKDFQKQMKAAQKEVKKMGDQASEGAKWLAQIGADGAISAEMIGAAMQAETSPGGRFYNGMEMASQTLSGMWSTLKDDSMQLLGNVFEPVTDGLRNFVLPAAQTVVSALNGIFEGDNKVEFSVEVQEAINNVTSLDENIDDLKKKYVNETIKIRLQAEDVDDLLTKYENKVNALKDTPKRLWSEQDKTDLQNLTTQIVGIYESLGQHVGRDGIFKPDVDSLRELIAAEKELRLIRAAEDYYASAYEKVVAAEVQKELIATEKESLEQQRSQAEESLAQWQKLGEQSAVAWGTFALDPDGLPDDLTIGTLQSYLGLVEQFIDLGGDFGSLDQEQFNLSDIIGETGEVKSAEEVMSSVDALSSLIGLLGEFDRASIEQTDLISSETLPQLDAKIIASSEALVTATANITAAYAELKNIEQTINRLNGTETGAEAGSASNIGEGIVTDGVQGVSESTPLLEDAVQSAVDTSAESADTGAMQPVGYEMGAGMASGMDSATPVVTAAAARLVKAAVKAARNAAMIKSPSRLFADEVGAYLSAGAAMGVDNNAWMLRKSIDNMIDQSIPDVSRIASSLVQKPLSFANGNAAAMAAAGTTNQTINFNVPVQTPAEFANTMFLYSTYGLTEA